MVESDVRQMRNRTIEEGARLGVRVPGSLPLLDEGLRLRNLDEVVSRLLAMHGVAAAAHGFARPRALEWLRQEKLLSALTESEKRFLVEEVGDARKFQNQVEGMWALAWAVGFAKQFDFGKECDPHFVSLFPNLLQSQSSTFFRGKSRLRPLIDVLEACDLAYCLHWTLRQGKLTGYCASKRIDEVVVVERRRALEWLLSTDTYDEVSLDT